METTGIGNTGSPDATKLMIRMVAIAALIIILIGIIYYRSLAAFPFALGVMVTSFLNIIKLRMLERTVWKIVQMDDQEAGKNVIRFQYLLRYFITGVVLVIIGLISNYTTQPPVYSSREVYIAVWAWLFPGAPDALKSAPFISIWGAIAGIFTLQLSVILVRSLKLEKDGDNFIKYKDDDLETGDNEDATEDDEDTITDDDDTAANDEDNNDETNEDGDFESDRDSENDENGNENIVLNK